MKFLGFLSLLLLLSSCVNKKEVDIIIHNAKIHAMDGNNNIYQAMAIKDGKIYELGPERQILNRLTAETIIDAEGKDVYPGFTDAHGHILSYARLKLSADLTGSKSFDEVLTRLERYQSKHKRKVIYGFGWDQSLWSNDSFPNNKKLNELFPTIPVCITRIDGHSLLANDAMLKLAGITSASKFEGGEITLNNGLLTGILKDNAMNPVYEKIPAFSEKEMSSAILEIQNELFQYGITNVHEAGITNKDIEFFKRLIDKKPFDLQVYAMLYPSKENIDFAKKNGIYKYKNLSIRSFKVMGDGALGSRGAFLKKHYHDDVHSHGLLTTTIEEIRKVAMVCEETGYQMNTHAIGDSTNNIILKLCADIFEVNKDHRWRIEHAQVVDPNDFELFSKYLVYPSVQPSHATSDQRWAEKRVGKERMKGAYAYQSLLKHTGILVIGTDFPIEPIDPFNTIHAAINRKNQEGNPPQGFYPEEAISLDDCLKGMTYWAALASFQENEQGTLETGKDASFAIFENPIKAESNYQANFARYTFIKGKKVYSID